MQETSFLFSEQSVRTIHWLLPRTAGLLGEDGAQPPDLLMSDFRQVRDLIGTPARLDAEIEALCLDEATPLPPAVSGLLTNVVTLFALAMDVFDDHGGALAWWQTPIRLTANGSSHAPREWIAEPHAAADLASRIRRTAHGIY